ncbi:MAG: hypothetical protein ACFB8W_25080 [Elainellaceae cyanobacterium]
MLLRCIFVLLISVLLGASSSIFTPTDSYWVEDLPETYTVSNLVQAATWSSPLVANVVDRRRLSVPKLAGARVTARLGLPTLQISHTEDWHSLSIALRQMRQLLWMLSRQWYALIVRGQLLLIEGYNR